MPQDEIQSELGLGPRPLWQRGLLALVLLVLLAIGYGFDLHHYLTLESLAQNRGLLGEQVARHPALMALAFVVLYAAAVAVSLPGATFLTITGGFLFGWLAGGALAVAAATLGAALVFEAAGGLFSDSLSRRAGPFVAKLRDGFRSNAFSYLLFLRLVPVFPFWLVNIAAALFHVNRRTFWSTTLLGITPGGFAFAFLGQGLGSVLDAQQQSFDQCVASKGAAACAFTVDTSAIVTPQLLLALAALGVMALIPVAIKKWTGQHV